MIASGILCLGSYLLAGLAHIPIMGVFGCALCGFSVGIMWPGSISISSKVIPRGDTPFINFRRDHLCVDVLIPVKAQ